MQWLLFQYSVPNKPSKLRVYVWRKLKVLRAEQLSEGMYVLPLTEKTTEHLEWLSAEVMEMNGSAVMWKAECLSEKQERGLIERFQARAAEGYRKIHEQLLQGPEAGRESWLSGIIRQYADVRYHDYFGAQQKGTLHMQIEQYYLKNRSRGENE